VIGTNTPALPLSPSRIAALPEPDRGRWTEYMQRSARQLVRDRAFLQRELRTQQVTNLTSPQEARSKAWMSPDRSADYYRQAEARRVAEAIVTFQTPAGGWSKNIDMTRPRHPGMLFGVANLSRFQGTEDFDLSDASWNYIGTFDNDATVMQLRFLARVIDAYATDAPSEAGLTKAFLQGIQYILDAQYPNGGWPQVWPLQGNYHDAITFNDNAIVNVLALLRNVSMGTNEFRFVPDAIRNQAAESFKKGLDCVLKTQVRTNGGLTVWPQQSDPLTLQPTSARNFEMVSLASAESANLMLFLMQLPKPSPEIVESVHAAAAWFEKTALRDVAYRRANDRGRVLLPADGEGPLWARYYEIGTDRPIFGDRDKTIHDKVDAVSEERRIGYSWFGDGPEDALERFETWRQRFPLRKN